MSFQYKPRDASKWDKRANQSGSNYANVIQDQFNTFSPRDGENSIRIAPPTWDDPEHYGYDVWVHFNVGPEGGTVLCLSRMAHKACPICEAQAKYEAVGREDANDFKPKRRVAVWLIDRKAEKPEDNPAIWTMGWTVDRDISKVCKDRETGELYMIDHPEAGNDVFFDKTGKADQTKYVGFAIGKRQNAIEKKHLDFIIANPIPSTLIWRDYKEVQDLFEGEAPPSDQAQAAAPATEAPTSSPVPAAQTIYIPPQPVAAPAPPPPPPAQFVAQWTNQHCSVCGELQFTTPTGVNCVNQHENVVSLEKMPPPPVAAATPVQAPPIAPPPPIAVPPAAAPTQIAERASAMKTRFQTGK